MKTVGVINHRWMDISHSDSNADDHLAMCAECRILTREEPYSLVYYIKVLRGEIPRYCSMGY